MTRHVLCMVAALAMVSFAACNGDDDPPKKDMKVDGPKVDGPKVDMKTTDGPKVDAGAGACVNATDTPLLDTEQERDDVSDATKVCALGCLTSDAGAAACTVGCVVAGEGLTQGCATCYAGVVSCAMTSCTMCVANPDGTECATCLETNCYPAFYTCSGLQE